LENNKEKRVRDMQRIKHLRDANYKSAVQHARGLALSPGAV